MAIFGYLEGTANSNVEREVPIGKKRDAETDVSRNKDEYCFRT